MSTLLGLLDPAYMQNTCSRYCLTFQADISKLLHARWREGGALPAQAVLHIAPASGDVLVRYSAFYKIILAYVEIEYLSRRFEMRVAEMCSASVELEEERGLEVRVEGKKAVRTKKKKLQVEEKPFSL